MGKGIFRGFKKRLPHVEIQLSVGKQINAEGSGG